MSDPAQYDGYSVNPRDDVRPFIPTGCASALDVGSGPGGFGATLRSALGPAARIDAVEAVASSAERARATGSYDSVLEGYFPQALRDATRRYDLICFNDVLEHIVEPGPTLAAAREYLTPGGSVLAAIPNIQYAPAVLNLIRGHWTYTDDGILDRTHVRFFTRESMLALFEDAGFRVGAIHGANSVSGLLRTDPNFARRVVKLGATRLLGNARYLHFVVAATPIASDAPMATPLAPPHPATTR